MTHLDSDSYVIHSTRPREPSEFSEIRICLRFRVYYLKTFARAHVGAMKNRGGRGEGKEKFNLFETAIRIGGCRAVTVVGCVAASVELRKCLIHMLQLRSNRVAIIGSLYPDFHRRKRGHRWNSF